MQGVEEQGKIFEDVEDEAAVDHPADEVFGVLSDVKSVIAEDARDGHKGNQQAANLQGQLDAVLVVHNVDAKLPVVLVAIAKQTHYRLILMKLSMSRSLPNSTKTSSFRMTVELSGTPIMCCFSVSSLFSISSKFRRMVTKLR